MTLLKLPKEGKEKKKKLGFCPVGEIFAWPFFLPLDEKCVKPFLTQELSYHDFREL